MKTGKPPIQETASDKPVYLSDVFTFSTLVLIIGAALAMLIGDSSTVLMIAIVAKIVVDVVAHIRERSRAITE